jgi:predicted RNA binding protein YcfA (HicA-like mRNA interferase family)
MTGREMVILYKAKGWVIDRVQGSHYVMKKDGMVEVIPVHGSRDLAKGLEKKLKKRVDIKQEIEK